MAASGRWVWRAESGDAPAALREAVADLGIGHPALVARLLWNRGVRDPDAVAAFLRPTLAHGLRSPLLLRDMDRAARRLADAIEAGERIAVYGDYDVDGIAGASQLVLCLRAFGASPLVHVSHREREGYGLNADVVRRLRAEGAGVMVTADCGTANAEEIRLAASLGLDVIVCDHHHAPAGRPPAFAVLNPLQADCGFPFKGLSGAGVVFYLLMGLRMALRARGRQELPDLRQYLDLVALGTVADVVPLRDENRVLVAHGLRALERPARPGIVALKESALVERASVHAIGFRLAPRLNASGRMADARTALELLTSDCAERARVLAAELEVHNAERRAVEEAMVAEAEELVRVADGDSRTLVVARDGWHAGVVGIVAARLAERYHRPALVIALEGVHGRGSGRGARGVDLHGALDECRELLQAFGGHRNAVGLTVRRDRVDALRARFEAVVRSRTTRSHFHRELEIDAEASLADMTPGLAEAIGQLEPHGPGNPETTFVVRRVEVVGLRTVGDPARPHLKVRLRQDGRTVSAIGFGLGCAPVHVGARVDVVCSPRLGRWQGIERLEIELHDLRPAASQSLEKAQQYAIP